MKKIFVVLVMFILPLFAMQAQNRGMEQTVKNTLGADAAIGKQWAVFIAIDRYNEWNPLSNPVKDAKEIRDTLKKNYYIDEVVELYDAQATVKNIRQLFVNLKKSTGKNDSVFVFYAGHGFTDSSTNTGHWIPVDAGRDDMEQRNWLPNIQIRSMLDMLPAKHVLLVSDACFSGDILVANRGAAPKIDSVYLRKAYSKVSRQVMTSGASESVPDSSEFSMRLKSLLNRFDGNCLDPNMIFTDVREVKATQPMLGNIGNSEHQEGGSFLFFRKTMAETAVAPPSFSAPAAPAMSGSAATGSINVTSEVAGTVIVDGLNTGIRVKAGGSATIQNVQTGNTDVTLRSDDGNTYRSSDTVLVKQGQAVNAIISAPKTAVQPAAVPRQPAPMPTGSTEVKIERDDSDINKGFKEHIFIDGKNVLTLTNGASGTVKVSNGTHRISAKLYTLEDETSFTASGGTLTIKINANSMRDFKIVVR